MKPFQTPFPGIIHAPLVASAWVKTSSIDSIMNPCNRVDYLIGILHERGMALTPLALCASEGSPSTSGRMRSCPHTSFERPELDSSEEECPDSANIVEAALPFKSTNAEISISTPVGGIAAKM